MPSHQLNNKKIKIFTYDCMELTIPYKIENDQFTKRSKPDNAYCKFYNPVNLFSISIIFC